MADELADYKEKLSHDAIARKAASDIQGAFASQMHGKGGVPQSQNRGVAGIPGGSNKSTGGLPTGTKGTT